MKRGHDETTGDTTTKASDNAKVCAQKAQDVTKHPRPDEKQEDTPNDDDDNTPLLLFVSSPEEPDYYCWTTPLTDVWTEEVIKTLSMSCPSDRKDKIPGCYGLYHEFEDASIWTPVENADVSTLKNIGRVVLGYFYE